MADVDAAPKRCGLCGAVCLSEPMKLQGFTGSQEEVKWRAEHTQANVDAQPPEIRALAHEFGWKAVSTLIYLGVKKPNDIRKAICRIRNWP